MKKIIYISLIFLPLNVCGQNYNELNTGRIHVVQTDSLEYLYNEGLPTVYGDGIPLIYSGSFWLGGVDVNEQLYLTANRYYQETEDQAGPLMANFADYSATIPLYQRSWKMTASEIDFHRQNFSQPGYVPSQAILEWPGNPPLGAMSNDPLAPYVDSNANGLYDPVNGDYPQIKGDEAIYFIRNNDCLHMASWGNIYAVEMHYMIYIFTNAADEFLDRVIFTDMTYRNHNTQTSFYTYVGAYHRIALGNSQDNYFGTEVSLGMQYFYNGDAYDEPNGGFPGFEDYPAALGILLLAGPWQDPDGIDNPMTPDINDAMDSLGIPYPSLGKGFGNGVVDDERLGLHSSNNYSGLTPIVEPSNPYQYYGSLKGVWNDATPFYFGGNGHGTSPGAQNNGHVLCRYLFPGNSDTLLWGSQGVSVPLGWDELGSGIVPGNRRALASTGPFTFLPGSTHTVELAYLYARDTTGGSSLDQLFDEASQLRSMYNLGEIPGHGSFYSGIYQAAEVKFSLFPNPAGNVFSVELEDLVNGSYLEIFDLTGALVYSCALNAQNSSINVSDLSGGVYLVKVNTPNGFGTHRLIKQ